MDEHFSGNLEHLMAGLRRIELKLHEQVRQSRQAESAPVDYHFRGLFISDQEIDAIVDRPSPIAVADLPTGAAEDSPDNVIIRLQQLKRLFHLSDFELDVLLICILPELDLRYQRLYGYLQDDITKKSPTINLVTNLLCETFEAKLKARQAFSPEAPLCRYQLLRLQDEQSNRPSPLLARFLQLDERIFDYLLGTDRIDRRLLSIARLVPPGRTPIETALPKETRRGLSQLVAHFKDTPLICQFLGHEGVGRKTTAELVCQQLGCPLLCVELKQAGETETPLELIIPLIFREGRLQNAALYFDHGDTLLNETNGAGAIYPVFIEELTSYPHWVFLAGEKRWQPDEKPFDKPFFYIEFPDPSYQTRQELWTRYSNHDSPLAADVNLADIAGKFRLSGGQIESAVAAAHSLALWRDPENSLITSQDIYAACRQQSRHRLSTLAVKINPKYGWDDIVLPPDQMAALREICSHVKHRHTVYGDWGFERKLSRGMGLNVLFAGPSGTGKTMAAEIMANELGLDLYKIDLAGIVSKYIGETEKNLDRIFQEGKTANAILFFDEADALFGKRSEVRDSHDRYANIEVAYLLQKMEEYDGMVILATNLRKNMDEAFARRMHFSVEFPVPDEADRLRIWQGVFPAEAPLAPDADINFMARQFKITGGNIKNIALGAAFLAAEDGGSITMEKMIRATKREYQKMGRLCTETEFAQYFELVRS